MVDERNFFPSCSFKCGWGSLVRTCAWPLWSDRQFAATYVPYPYYEGLAGELIECNGLCKNLHSAWLLVNDSC